MKLGNIVRSEQMKDIPQMEVIQEDGRVFYLSPFRANGFQVSGTIEGTIAYGVSDFIKLENVTRAHSTGIAKTILRALIIDALADFNRQWGGKAWYPHPKEEKIIADFMDKTLVWLKKLRIEEMKHEEAERKKKKKIDLQLTAQIAAVKQRLRFKQS